MKAPGHRRVSRALTLATILFALPAVAQQQTPNIKVIPFTPPRPALPEQAGKHRDLKAKWDSLPAAKRK